MTTPSVDFRALLERLRDDGIDFIVVGGVSAVLHGAPIVTFDLDIVPSRSPPNLDRLHSALLELEAIFRDPAARKLTPTRSDLAGMGHLLLRTSLGPLDVLCSVAEGRTHESLLPKSTIMDLGGGLSARVVDLDELIALKRAAGREKDRAALPLLERTLEETRKRREG